MKLAFIYLLALTLIMGGALAYGFIVGDFWVDGGDLMDNPWGIVSLFDVYVGFFFFIGWIAYRESCPGFIMAWSVGILLGGNLVAGIYAILALYNSKGDSQCFLYGERKRLLFPKRKRSVACPLVYFPSIFITRHPSPYLVKVRAQSRATQCKPVNRTLCTRSLHAVDCCVNRFALSPQ
jgi:hypothetical protein